MAKKVYIAAGHGGGDSGAVSGGFVEKSLNLKVATYMADYLKDYDCEVKMSRTTDNGDNTISRRCAEAKAWGANCFIEIHHNAGGGDGGEVYYWKNDDKAKELATAVAWQYQVIGQNSHGNIIKASSPNANNFGICRNNSANGIPAILGEFAFVDNVNDRKIIESDAKLRAEGEAYAKGVISFLWLCKKSDKQKPVKPAPIKSNDNSNDFVVRIICDTLNIRKSSTSWSRKVGEVKKGAAFTIVDTNRERTWGKLKSGAGWICIKSAYVKRV